MARSAKWIRTIFVWGMSLTAAVCGLSANLADELATVPHRSVPIVGHKAPEFSLPDATGKQWALSTLRDKPVVVLFCMGTDCPISNLSLKELSDLWKRYEARGVEIVGIHSNAGVTSARVAEHSRQFKVLFPVLIDAGQRVADGLGATRSAEVFLLDRQRVVRYHGAVDDRYGYTYKRSEPKRRDLEEAIKELLSGKKVTVAETIPRGCLITRDDRPSNESGGVTFARDISRIFQNRCSECHRSGEVAPFALTTYDEAVEHSAMIKEVVMQRRMPPWHADPRYGDFSNSRRMPQQEIDKVSAWVDAGAPLGDRSELPPPREYVEGWQIGKPDFVFELPNEVNVPASGTLAYRYYTVPTNFKEDVWIQAAEARADNRAVVHHIIVFYRDPSGKQTDGGGLIGSHVCGTAPGDPPLVLPPGVGRRIPAGATLIFQMHYTPNGKAGTDRSKVGFVRYKEGTPKIDAKTRPILNPRFRIPPGDSNYRVESSFTFPQDATIYQLMPHMHVRGKDFLYELKRPDGRREILLSVPNYDFNWQNTYRFTTPVNVPKGSTMRCVAHFDNSKENPANPDPTKTVTWGDQTWQEMMIGWMTIATDAPPQRAAGQEQAKRDP